MEAITCRRIDGLPNYFSLYCGDDYLVAGGAVVEGNAADMLALASAMERGAIEYGARRCATIPIEGGGVALYSPRNSQGHALVPAALVPGLIASIRDVVTR